MELTCKFTSSDVEQIYKNKFSKEYLKVAGKWEYGGNYNSLNYTMFLVSHKPSNLPFSVSI